MKKLDSKQPLLLTDCMTSYLAYLNNNDLLNKTISKAYIMECDRFLQYYIEALKIKNVEVGKLNFTDVNDELIDYVYEYLANVKNYSNLSLNKFFAFLKKFTGHIIQINHLNYRNPFSDVPKMSIIQKNILIDIDEFYNLLNIVTPENGIQQTLKSKTNLYKPWLKDAYWLAILCGARTLELLNLKWSDIKSSTNVELSFIHYRSGKAIRKCPISLEFSSKLIDLGYFENKGKDKYILAPEESMNRDSMAALLVKSFKHYYKQLENGKNMQFRHLRIVYINSILNIYK